MHSATCRHCLCRALKMDNAGYLSSRDPSFDAVLGHGIPGTIP